mgnify:CR=1 FL=1
MRIKQNKFCDDTNPWLSFLLQIIRDSFCDNYKVFLAHFYNSIVNSTGQWSDPKMSVWIWAPLNLSFNESEVRKINQYANPAFFSRAFETIGPPWVNSLLLRIEIAECIRKTWFKQSSELCTLFISETCIFPIRFRILQIYLLMCYIQITTHNYRFFLFQFLQISTEIIIPFHSIIQPSQFFLRIRSINSYQIIRFQFKRNYTAFVIVLFNA